METSTMLKIIDEICIEKNIEENLLSFGWIRELKKNGKIRHIVRNTFDLNPAGAYDIVNDKYATYEVLKKNNIEVLKHIMLFNPITREKFAENLEKQVEEALEEFNGQVIVKANNSCQGKDVFLLTKKDEIIEKVKELFKKGSNGVSACPYRDIDAEYRVIYLDGNIEYVYKKEKPYVIGNGESSLKELIQEKSFKGELDNSLNLEYIPFKDQKITISWKHNLCSGAVPKTFLENDKYIEKVKEIALKAAQVTNVRFASIDISQDKNEEIFVMEINGNVCMSKFAEEVPDGYKIAKEIYAKAIDKMFM